MKTVLCHGVFDLLHYGHIRYFKAAKQFGDHLTVSITSDRFVKKGPGRPHFPAEIRKQMLKSLACVDRVVISDSPTAVSVIETLKPDFYVKGPDYRDLSADPTGGIVAEKDAVEAYGGKLVFTEEPTFSSSELINKYMSRWTPEQKETIERVRELGGIELIKKLLNEISELSVSVVGEFITDRYVFCEPTGISNKASSVSARIVKTEEYQGGTWYVINNLKEFVDLSYYRNVGTNIKTRYLSHESNQKIFEATHINDTESILDRSSLHCKNDDLLVVCDFGHGLFEGPNLEIINKVKIPIALNVQTNSSNVGFNPFTKHKRFDYLTLDLKEGRLATHDRYSDKDEIFAKVQSLISNGVAVAMTEGPNGSRYAKCNVNVRAPAFANRIVDATGAGDAFFAITTLFDRVGAPPELIPFVGNVFAGLKTEIMGTSRPVTKAEFLKAVEGILK